MIWSISADRWQVSRSRRRDKVTHSPFFDVSRANPADPAARWPAGRENPAVARPRHRAICKKRGYYPAEGLPASLGAGVADSLNNCAILRLAGMLERQ